MYKIALVQSGKLSLLQVYYVHILLHLLMIYVRAGVVRMSFHRMRTSAWEHYANRTGLH